MKYIKIFLDCSCKKTTTTKSPRNVGFKYFTTLLIPGKQQCQSITSTTYLEFPLLKEVMCVYLAWLGSGGEVEPPVVELVTKHGEVVPETTPL